MINNMKIVCQTCGISKPIKDYLPDLESITRYNFECKKCSGDQDRFDKFKLKNKYKCVRKERAIYLRYRISAKDRNLEFSLTLEDMQRFRTRVPCYYCGDKLKRIGIDRVDNSKGYTLDNCVPCCTTCNRMKMAHTTDFFLNHLDKISKNMMKEIIRLRIA